MTRIEIPFRLPGLNEVIQKNREHRQAGAALKKNTETAIMYALKACPLRIQRKVQIHFIWYEKTRRRDPDNIAGAKKFILDAMQKSGILPNDSSRYIAGFRDDFVFGEKDGVLIEIKEDGTTGNENL